MRGNDEEPSERRIQRSKRFASRRPVAELMADSEPATDPPPMSFQPQRYDDDAPSRRPGERIAPHLELKEKLWEGETADVWRAHDHRRGADVAIKIVRPRSWLQPNVRKLFLKSIEAAEAVRHDRVVSMLEHGRATDGIPYIVMEMVVGQSLSEVLATLDCLEPDEVVRLVDQVASALAQAHASDVVHGELEPANIVLLEGRGVLDVKVANFCLACTRTNEHRPHVAAMHLEAPHFLSPERLLGEHGMDDRLDLWALAAIAFLGLTGRAPFPAETLVAYHAMMREGEPPSACALRPELPEAVDRFFTRALARDRDERFPDADILADAFREALAGCAADPDRPPPLERVAAMTDRLSMGPRSVQPVSSERTYLGETQPVDTGMDGPDSFESRFISTDNDRNYAPGARITSEIELREKIGVGGMGEVWRARHHGLDRDVAVKLISRQAWSQRDVRQRLAREEKLAKLVDHPHAVSMLEHGRTVDDLPFLVMELLSGTSLEDLIVQGRWLSVEETARLVSQVAGVLSVAHARGVVHRDIKPENILVEQGEDLVVKLVDFGIAKSDDAEQTQLTATGMLIGTPLYMNPEQLSGMHQADAHADLWSLAAVAYTALTGDVPFPAETLTELMTALSECELTPPSDIVAGIPPAIDDFFVRALAAERSERYASASDLAEAYCAAANLSGETTQCDGMIRPTSHRPDDEATEENVALDDAAEQSAPTEEATVDSVPPTGAGPRERMAEQEEDAPPSTEPSVVVADDGDHHEPVPSVVSTAVPSDPLGATWKMTAAALAMIALVVGLAWLWAQ